MTTWRSPLLVLLPLVCRLATSGAPRDTGDVTEYCVIGAGPAGLQMGHFLQRAGRNYVILERNSIPGSFFAKYPRHRTLISINKRHTDNLNREFNERHDWNSLLSDDPRLLFGRYSQEFFPNADSMVRYLADFKTALNLTVRYGVNISRIARRQRDAGFLLHTSAGGVTCRYVIVATGLWQMNKPVMKGQEHVVHYDDVSVQPEHFRGKNVLILGRGNAAFETASNISGHTNLVHMVARTRARLAWSTHYVGDLRAINNNLLDTYQLKSLDGLLETDVEEMRLVRHKGRIHVRPAGVWPRAQPVVASLNRTANRSGLCGEQQSSADACGAEWTAAAAGGETSPAEPLATQDNFALRDGYDVVIGCLGFKFDFSIFDSSTHPGRPSSHGKFPAVKADWGSLVTPGLYFAGAASHALDFRRSAGGFLHGYRYTARALHRILEWRNHQSAWPATFWPLTELVNVIVRRLNTAAGPYQMFAVLCDVIVFQNDRSGFLFVPEFPVGLLHRLEETSGHRADLLLVLSLEYGADFSGPGQDTFRWDRAISDPLHAEKSNFLHPVIYFYERPPSELDMLLKPPTKAVPAATRVHHVLEDFLTDWKARHSHVLPLRRFLEACLAQDLRHFQRGSCLRHALTNRVRPLQCS